MFKLHAVEGRLKSLQFVTVTDRNSFKSFNLDTELVDDSPGNHLFTSDPNPCFLIIGLSKEELQVEQVSETATLEDLNLDSRQEGVLSLCGRRLRHVLKSADELAFLLVNAVVQKGLEMAAEGGELLNFQVLAGLQLLKFISIDTSQE